MLAARDQENRVFGGTVAGGKHHNALNPKTPGGKGAQTPFKGKSVLGGRPGNENINMQRTVGKGKGLVTPMEPRTAARAPLGNKTTNGKALQQQQQQTQKNSKGVKDIVNQFEQTSQAPPTGRRARVISPRTNTTNSTKLSVLSDQSSQSATVRRVPDVEYCPPPVAPARYESDVFPEGVLTFAAFEPQNRLRGYYEHYFINKNNPVDETDGVPLRDKAMAERQRKAFEKLDIQVQKDLEEFDWAAMNEANTKAAAAKAAAAKVATVKKTTTSTTKSSQPPTIALRNAASALALGSKKTIRAPSASRNAVVRPKMTAAEAHAPSAATASSVSSSLISGLPLRKATRPMSALSGVSAMPVRTKPSTAANLAAESASRTTLGYNKGRTALSMVRGSGNSALNANTFVNPNATPKDTAAPSKLRSVASQPAIKRFVPSTEIASLDTNEIDIEVPSTPVAKSHLQMQMPVEEERSPAFVSIFDVDVNSVLHSEDEDDDDDVVPNDEEVTLGMGIRNNAFASFGGDEDDFQMDANFE